MTLVVDVDALWSASIPDEIDDVTFPHPLPLLMLLPLLKSEQPSHPNVWTPLVVLVPSASTTVPHDSVRMLSADLDRLDPPSAAEGPDVGTSVGAPVETGLQTESGPTPSVDVVDTVSHSVGRSCRGETGSACTTFVLPPSGLSAVSICVC